MKTIRPNIADVLMNGINPDGTVTVVEDFILATEDQILAAHSGASVEINGPKFKHVLTFGSDQFHVNFAVDQNGPHGHITCNEENIRLLRFV